MIVGDISFAEAAESVRDAEQRIGRAVNLVVYPPDELTAKAHGGHHFVSRSCEGRSSS